MWRKSEYCFSCGNKLKEAEKKYVCAGCNCLMKSPVKTIRGYGGYSQEYCGKCAPPYDAYQEYPDGYHYFRAFRCNSDGTLWKDPSQK